MLEELKKQNAEVERLENETRMAKAILIESLNKILGKLFGTALCIQSCFPGEPDGLYLVSESTDDDYIKKVVLPSGDTITLYGDDSEDSNYSYLGHTIIRFFYSKRIGIEIACCATIWVSYEDLEKIKKALSKEVFGEE